MEMNKEMLDLCAWVVKTAKAAGADSCVVNLDNSRSVEISYRDRKPENIKEASTQALNIQVFVNGRYSVQSTSDLRKEALRDFMSNAVTATRLLAEDPYRTLPDPKYYQGRTEADLGLVDDAYAGFSPENRHEMAKAVENACLQAGGDKVISVTSQVQDGSQESVMVASNGFEGYAAGTYYAPFAEMTARDAGERRPNGYSYAVTVCRRDLPRPEEIGIQAARRTLDLMGAKKIKTETLPVIIENQNVGRLFGGFLGAMFGRSIQQKRSFLADKKGQPVASRLLTLVDDPLIPKGLGSRAFDGDGLAARKRVLIEAGVLKEFFVDWYYGRKLGWEPTSGSPSNLVVPPGTRSLPAIMKDLGRGVLITGFIGGNSNPTTGDASIGIIGKLFENGEPTQSIAEMNIADNHLKFWHKLIEVANDPFPYSSNRFPSMVFENVVVSGV
jgi:PmbA protein